MIRWEVRKDEKKTRKIFTWERKKMPSDIMYYIGIGPF